MPHLLCNPKVQAPFNSFPSPWKTLYQYDPLYNVSHLQYDFFPGGATLIFEVELLKIERKSEL